MTIEIDGDKVPYGCWCWVPLAATKANKDCWARANGLDIGWPDNVRPQP